MQGQVLCKARPRHLKSPCSYWVFEYTLIWLTFLNSSMSKPVFSDMSITILAVHKMIVISVFVFFPFSVSLFFFSVLISFCLIIFNLFFSLWYFVFGQVFKDIFDSIYMECFKIFLTSSYSNSYSSFAVHLLCYFVPFMLWYLYLVCVQSSFDLNSFLMGSILSVSAICWKNKMGKKYFSEDFLIPSTLSTCIHHHPLSALSIWGKKEKSLDQSESFSHSFCFWWSCIFANLFSW